MTEHLYGVIMAGGGGTRLWPVSRQKTPKQMIQLFGDRSLFQIAVDRLEGFIPPERIFVVTTAEQMELLRSQDPRIAIRNYLVEPQPRGTAAVVAMAAGALSKKDPEAVLAILTADHLIKDISRFQQYLIAAYDVANNNNIVTLGIKPTFAATGYGYIESDTGIGTFSGIKAFSVKRFIEKPQETLAREFCANENFTWNSGMFISRVDTLLEEFRNYMPDLFNTISGLMSYLGVDHRNNEFVSGWSSIQPQTIDYGIMEKTRFAAVLPAKDLGWNDVGSWDSFFEVANPDPEGNIVIKAQHVGIDTTGTMVVSNAADRLIVTLGMKNIIVIETDDALLICPRGESQRVKELVNYLKANHYILFL